MREQLPPTPKPLARHLTNEQTERLLRRYPISKKVPATPRGCVTCGGTKVFRWWSQTDRSKVVEYDCNCVEQWKMHRQFLSHGIPTNYQRLGWQDVDADPGSASAVVDYLEDKEFFARTGKGLFLYGDIGTGKTLLAALVLKSFLAAGFDGVFTSFVDLASAKSDGWDDPSDRDYFTKSLRNCDVLFIDDPGKEYKGSERQAEYASSVLDEVIRFRVSMEIPTIMTSNDTPDKFAQRYNRFVASLVEEGMIIQHVTGSNFRERKHLRDEAERTQRLSRPIVVG